jgi:tetratricopeptide (TPR) repeat protein
MTIQQAYELAITHHQAGRFVDAEQLCRQILSQQPDYLDAQHLLGVLAYHSGRQDVALQLLGQVIRAAPNAPDPYVNLGVVYMALGRRDQAIAAYDRALELSPGLPSANNNLGNALMEAGEFDHAIECFEKALSAQPDWAEVIGRIGNALYRKGQIDDAIVHYRRALAIQPQLAEFHNNLGNALYKKERVHDAMVSYQRAITLNPGLADAYNNLGTVHFDRGELEEAYSCYQRALAIRPNFIDAANNLADVFQKRGQIDQAISCLRQAMSINPNFADTYNNLGRMLVEKNLLDEALGFFNQAYTRRANYVEAVTNIANVMYRKNRLDDAIAYSRQALNIQPDYASAHWNMGLSLLCKGRFHEGWKEFAWRSQVKELRGIHRQFLQPMWDGRNLNGQTLLLHSEQGFGDTIQFIRYLPKVTARGARVIVDCRPELIELMKQNFQADQWITRNDPLPAFDLQCPLMSLPMVLGTTLANIPSEVPYIVADAGKTAMWKERLKGQVGLKVGMVWAGLPEHDNDRNRSLPFQLLEPLLAIVGITFISLQKGKAAAQMNQSRSKSNASLGNMIDWTSDLGDFSDTAALLANLDLVVTVDTAMAHLAGAMGKPVWVLLPFSPDWRWMLDRDDSPWYPTMRLLRQRQLGDWNDPIQQASAALQNLLAQHKSKGNS